jgi:hypothetical protein
MAEPPRPKTEGVWGKIFVGVAIALLASGSSPWWWCKVFSCTAPVPVAPPAPTPTPGSTPVPSPSPSPAPTPASARCPARTVSVAARNIETSAVNARVVHGDAEIDSDDYTRVGLSYRIVKTPNDRGLRLELSWFAQELNRNKSFGDTRILSEKSFQLYSVDADCPDSTIEAINGLVLEGSRETDYRGKVHRFSLFPATGALANIQVKFDSTGRNDVGVQALRATVSEFTVRLTASP